jgi:hypothetical protein
LLVREVVDELGGEHIVVLLSIEVENVLAGGGDFRVLLAFTASQFNGKGVFVNGVDLDAVTALMTPPDQGDRNVARTAAHVEEAMGLVAIPGLALAPEE